MAMSPTEREAEIARIVARYSMKQLQGARRWHKDHARKEQWNAALYTDAIMARAQAMYEETEREKGVPA
ncbi:MAG: hypothetical protein V2A79_14835 [Planctomycetota bacterium]